MSNRKKYINLPALPNSHLEPLIEMISNREAIVEGISGIVEYSDTVIEVNCKQYILNFTGFDLSIKSLSSDCVSVNGHITQINFFTM